MLCLCQDSGFSPSWLWVTPVVLQPVALPRRSAGCPTDAILFSGQYLHTAFPSPVKWHNITCPSCSFSGAVRNQFSDRSQLSGALVKGGGDTALPTCPVGTECSIPETLAVALLFVLMQRPRQQRGIQGRGETWAWAPGPPLLAPLLTLSAAVRRVHGLSALRS